MHLCRVESVCSVRWINSVVYVFFVLICAFFSASVFVYGSSARNIAVLQMLSASRASIAYFRRLRVSTLRPNMSAKRNVSNKSFKTASYLLIGDEVLSGTVQDTNGPFLAQYFRKRGIDLTRIEVIPDKVC